MLFLELQVNAGFFRLAKYNASEWPYFVLGSIGSAVLGLVMPFFALVTPQPQNLTTQLPAFKLLLSKDCDCEALEGHAHLIANSYLNLLS